MAEAELSDAAKRRCWLAIVLQKPFESCAKGTCRGKSGRGSAKASPILNASSTGAKA